jgi:hypothetical protein
MLIEESILIKADIKKIWKTFTDLTCWADWNTVARDAVSDSGSLEKGDRFTFCIRPFSVPITLKPRIEEVVPARRVVWSGSKFGIFSRHEFLFQQVRGGVLVTSKEAMRGLLLHYGGQAFTKVTVRKLTIAMLNDLKDACEQERT